MCTKLTQVWICQKRLVQTSQTCSEITIRATMVKLRHDGQIICEIAKKCFRKVNPTLVRMVCNKNHKKKQLSLEYALKKT